MQEIEIEREGLQPSCHPELVSGSQDVGKRTGFFAPWAQNDERLLRHPEFISGSQAKRTKRFRLGADFGKCAVRGTSPARLSEENDVFPNSQKSKRGRNDENGGLNDAYLPCHPVPPSRHPEFISGSQKCAFTLAEVLITLGIIGVVAAMTLPTVINNVQARIKAEQIRSAKYKFTEATDAMKSLDLIGPYDSTEAFVNELKKHLKIAKVCPANKLEGCWPTKEVKLDNEGKMYEISKAQTGKQFKMESNDKNDYTSQNVGIVTADGVPMIISYNKKCEPLDPVKSYAWTTEDNKPVSNATAGCVAAVMDVNGNKKPNKLGEDVVLFNAKGLGAGCGMEVGGKCFSAPIASYAPLTRADCEVRKDELGIKDCMSTSYGDNDYWGGAVAACGHVSKMATMADLGTIATALYGVNVGAMQDINSGLTYNTSTAGKLGLPNPSFRIWSGQELSQYDAYNRAFTSYYTHWHYNSRLNTGFLAVCKGDS